MVTPPRCPHHGVEACPACSANPESCGDPDAVNVGCGYYAATGMHWDTCPNREKDPDEEARDWASLQQRLNEEVAELGPAEWAFDTLLKIAAFGFDSSHRDELRERTKRAQAMFRDGGA